MLGAFVIFLREGIEGSMLVAALLAYLRQIGRMDRARDVYAGVFSALALALLGGTAAYFLIRTYDGSRVQIVFETATYLLATAVLTYMTFWMRRQSRQVRGDLQRQADAALGRGSRFALFAIAFQAVGREGLEAVVFLLAIALGTAPWALLSGALAGLAGALLLARLIYGVGVHLPLGRFFAWLGTLLFVVAAGLLANAVENLQALGWLPFGAQPLWSTAGLLSEDSPLGDLLHAFTGYAARPTALQVAIYALYLAAVLAAFLGAGRTTGRRRERDAAGGA